MWVKAAAVALAFVPGDMHWTNGVYCDSYGDARTFLEAYRISGDMELSAKAASTPEKPQVCGFVQNVKSLYVKEESKHFIRNYEFTIHKVWLDKYNALQWVITREELENS